MGIPNIIYGEYGDEKVTSSTKIGNLPLGQVMVLADGRLYRHARAGAVALLVGTVLRQGADSDTVMDQDVLFLSAAAAGTTKVTLTMGATALVADYYKDGYLYTSLSAGVGTVYKIDSHIATGTNEDDLEFTMEENDAVSLAVVAASSKAGLRRNDFDALIINPGGTEFKGMIAGIPPVAVAASSYFWCQRRGTAVAQNAAASAVIGEQVAAATSEAGSVETSATTSKEEYDFIGHGMSTGAAATYVLINLELE